MIYSPEPPIEPRYPDVFDFCLLCGGEIYRGSRYYRAQNGSVCYDCAEKLTLFEEIAGEDNEWT